MNSSEIRQAFLDFFRAKGHEIQSSAPIVVKNDPTLMFTNAGMNQFKDIFLGNSPAQYKRVVNSQKCLRVSGKHNDLEEVGKDTYHHTMFEMLGNWSFGDYFKKEAIAWAWEFLTEVLKINKENLYATVFGGDEKDGTEKDMESYAFWKEFMDEEHILFGTKKDNFWEMGDTGPCGPCSEIHIDIRNEEEKKKVLGRKLVNTDHPQVIEIWNLVFIQYQRFANGKLELLPEKYVDTGMGFERLCMVLQEKQSSYDTDIFQPCIQEIARMTRILYNDNKEQNIAMKVIADHLRAVAFTIADGQLPSNTGAGYVIRRILRRAVRYGFTFLKFDQPFVHQLLPALVDKMGGYFHELEKQKIFIEKVIQEEEQSFLRTLSRGIQHFEQCIANFSNKKVIDGEFAFELFDTYGFPIDLTQLMASEKGYSVNMETFNKELAKQKERSRAEASLETGDWIEIRQGEQTQFKGYDLLSCEVEILRYRKMKTKDKEFYQLIFNQTPFYAEAGGQVGDGGYIESNGVKTTVFNTKKENDLSVHLVHKLPEDLSQIFVAQVDTERRCRIECNHTATHLLHEALREILGTHVEQKGSFVEDTRLRFDFSHFAKLTDEELRAVERRVNERIRTNDILEDFRQIPISEAEKMGAMALFGEKYGEIVRVVKCGKSIEFCGGTHVRAAGNIGIFKILSEGAIAAGIRRIEAITGKQVEEHFYYIQDVLRDIRNLLHTQQDFVGAIHKMINENAELKNRITGFQQEQAKALKERFLQNAELINGIHVLSAVFVFDPEILKSVIFALRSELDTYAIIIGTSFGEKPTLLVAISENLVAKGKNASDIVREAAKEIQGGGGGQPTFATAGGKNLNGLENAVLKAKEIVVEKIA
jgi:alanyl-tRNA synthetase